MKKEERIKKVRAQRRTKRTRMKLVSNKSNPRLTVFRSNKYIYAQLIDDKKGKTLVSTSEKEIESAKINKIEKAKLIGQKIAEKALAAKIKKVVFDKGPYRYHGRVKALAEAAREGGLQF